MQLFFATSDVFFWTRVFLAVLLGIITMQIFSLQHYRKRKITKERCLEFGESDFHQNILIKFSYWVDPFMDPNTFWRALFFALMCIGMIGIIFLSFFACIVGIFFGSVSIVFWRYFEGKRFTKKFEKQLPDVLEDIARSLQTGVTIYDAVQTAAQRSGPPFKPMFQEQLRTMRYGVTLTEMLSRWGRRYAKLPSVGVFVAVLLVSYRMGSASADALFRLAKQIREDALLENEIAALSVQARFSSYILAALPLVFGILMYVVEPNIWNHFLQTSFGVFAISIGLTLTIIGFFWMSYFQKNIRVQP